MASAVIALTRSVTSQSRRLIITSSPLSPSKHTLRHLGSQPVVSETAQPATPMTPVSQEPVSSLPVHRLQQTLLESSLKPRLAWVENMDTIERRRVALVELHPDVFAVQPKLHLIHQNVQWQKKYRYVNYDFARTRAEMPGGGRKPWPQKGTGRARHGSIRSPLFKGGGVAHGPRGPNSHFFMLSAQTRASGLCSTLSVKLAQGDLHVVDSLDGLSSPSAEDLQRLVSERQWLHSVLFVDSEDVFPENMAVAAEGVPQFNLMPVYGLNVYSMLKHDTLVFTLSGLQLLQQRIVDCIRSFDDPARLKDPSFFA